MKRNRNITLILFGMLSCLTISAQVQIGNWREHLSYRKGLAVCKAENKVYCAAFPSLFYYDTEDNSVQKMNKVNGMSDIEVNTLAYSSKHKTVIVGYKNGNIDLIQDGEIINVPDVKRSFLQGDKAIKSILVAEDKAYLGTGFGILELNLNKNEISETYTLNTGGGSVSVHETCIKNDTIYAATNSGIFLGSLKANLSDFQNWIKMSGLPEGSYNTIVVFNDELLTNIRMEGAWQEDTVYRFDGNQWNHQSLGPNYKNDNVTDFNVADGKLLVGYDFGGEVLKADYSQEENLWTYGDSYTAGTRPSEIIYENGSYWIADQYYSLVHRTGEFNHNVIVPSGPEISNAWNCTYSNGHMWVASGVLTPNMKTSFSNLGIAKFENEQWTNYFATAVFDSLRDIHEIVIDPDDPKHIFAASYGGGILEFKNGERVKIFNETNSTVQSLTSFEYRPIGGVALDKNKTLWASNSGPIEHPLIAKDAEGNWYGYKLNNIQSSGETSARSVLIDNNNTKWILIYLKGVVAFNENGTLGDTSDDSFKLLSSSTSSGALPSNEIYALAQDQDGKLWVGGIEGLAVINFPENVFEDVGVTAERVIIEDAEGNASYLLADEIITSIKIDAGNRKWIATQGAGVILMSANMQEKIHHFNSLNSPLLSDIVYDIEIDASTGEVFFTTDKGLVSFMGDATDSSNYDGQLYSFPNPVPPGYTGTIGIRGITNNAEVKIVDITGNLVYETISVGGTATWDGKRLDGRKVQSGVYVVLTSNEDGSVTQTTKILLVN